MRIKLAIVLLGVALAADAGARTERAPSMRKIRLEITDEAIFACACPGAVEFCKEWEKKWRHLAAPHLRNQSAADCVLDMMAAIEGRPPYD